jgi:hypothetical protein
MMNNEVKNTSTLDIGNSLFDINNTLSIHSPFRGLGGKSRAPDGQELY